MAPDTTCIGRGPAQLPHGHGSQPFGTLGKQVAMPVVQHGQGERLIELIRGSPHQPHQTIHPCAVFHLRWLQRELQPPCDGGAHIGGIQLFSFNRSRVETLTAQQRGQGLRSQGGIKTGQALCQALALLMGLLKQGLQAGGIPAERRPVGLLLDPALLQERTLIASGAWR